MTFCLEGCDNCAFNEDRLTADGQHEGKIGDRGDEMKAFSSIHFNFAFIPCLSAYEGKLSMMAKLPMKAKLK